MTRSTIRPASHRLRRAWQRLTAATALATAAALTASAAPAIAAVPSTTASATSVVTGAEQLRADQCAMGTVLRIGGPAEKAVARQALDGTPAQLRAVAADTTGSPLEKAWDNDFQASISVNNGLQGRPQVWQQYLPMSTPPGYTEAKWGFAPNFFETVGLSGWVADDYAPVATDLTDPTIPVADKAAQDAALALGNGRYTTGGNPAEQSAWNVLASDSSDYPLAADDARMLLEDGGFPTSAPAPGSADFRIAVEDLKARYASCDWRNPADPDSVLGTETSTAADEWQHEVASQQAQRDTVLTASQSATAALAKASQDIGELLGRSWQAGRLATWQQYWTGPGRVGVAPITFHLTASSGRCIDDPGTNRQAGTRLWLYTCNSSAAQNWTYDQTTQALTDQGASLCMDVDGAHGPQHPGSAVQLWGCNGSASQRWDLTVGGTVLRNIGTGLCVDLHTADLKQYGQAWTCNGGATQRFTAVQNDTGAGATGVHSLSYPTKADFANVTKGLGEARAEAKSSLDDLGRQLTTAQADAAQVQSAQQQAYAIADQEGAPRGRGLLAAQQEAQVTLATVAALQAADKAGSTAYQATTAAADQGQTLQALAVTQAHESKAAFDAAAAAAADQQAKDAAAGAAQQAQTAAKAEADAKTQLAAAQAGAADAYADAESSNADAGQAQQAATQADQDAAAATTAATDAQLAANDATGKAVAADSAATQAQAAADQADAAAKDAAAQKATADQAVATDNAAAAKAIGDSQTAAAAAATAQQDAATAKAQSTTAHADAGAAAAEAAKSQTAAATAAGYAWATAQAATAASDAAQQVAAPANDAIQLGAPYQDGDTAAGLAVLTAQASMTVAEQQAAAAQARSAAAQQAAQQAQAAAAAASGDAKDAATSAADASAQSAAATASAAQAVASADRAREYADQTQAADAAAQQYDDQTAAALATAQADADQAQGDATAAKTAATAADSDATAGQQAATTASTAAAAARQDAAKADQDAAAAAAAAKDADQQAAQAQQAATQAEQQQDQKVLDSGTPTGVAHVFTTEKVTPVGDPKPLNTCVLGLGNSGCDVTFQLTFTLTVDFYFCDNPAAPDDVTATGCPPDSSVYLGSQIEPGQTGQVTHHFSNWDFTRAIDEAVLKALWGGITQDFVDCWNGSAGGCGMAATWLVPQNKILEAIRIANAVQGAIKASDGLDDALTAIRAALKAKTIDGTIAAGMDVDVATRAAELARFTRAVDPKLIARLQAAGTVFSRKDLLWIATMPGGKLAFLETGKASAGLIHVISGHGAEFVDNGIALKDIPDFIQQALTVGKVVGQQRDAGRPIYELMYNGVLRHVAITVGDNGFVVGANLV